MKYFILFLFACLVTIILTPFGIFWNLGKSILTKGFINFIKYWLRVVYQVIVAIIYFIKNIRGNVFYNLAFTLDLLWNALSGELLEDIFTPEENTAFGVGDITVSAAIGRQEERGKLTPVGKWFSNVLNKFFKEPTHCKTAWLNVKTHFETYTKN